MKKTFTTFCLIWVMVAIGQAAPANVAYRDDNVRFTLISEGTIRLEWSADGRFTDQKSFMATEREYEPVKFKVKHSGDMITVTTSQMTLTYKIGTSPLNADNLTITSAKNAKVPFVWHPGMQQTGNLGGTFRTLDECDGDIHYPWNKQLQRRDTIPVEQEKGLLATCGWTLLDDSDNFLFTDEEQPWVTTRSEKGAQDWYFMAYGHDYRRALFDYTRFAGRIPLPPRYAFGYWWSRYWAYTDKEFMSLIEHFDSCNMPIDVLVIDMDWHYHDGVRGGWTGYNWNRELIPDPDGLLDFIHAHGLHTTLNLHPADGIRTREEAYLAVAEQLGITDGSDIPWTASDRNFMNAWMEKVLRPLEKQGVDFWWLDWQQFANDRKVEGLSNTWWLNYFVFTDMERNRTERPMLYHRWGGLGNHRYQIGFSGDAFCTWKSLQYQPYFTSTAGNVLYGYWSHDLGGHMMYRGEKFNKELYMRWMQYGVFSPIMRTHSSKDGRMTKEPWMLGDTVLRVVGNAIRERYRLLPYIYTMARKAYDTGVSICRPLYYDYPDEPKAYDPQWRNQYMFGDNMLVAPVTEPMVNGESTVTIWLPEGTWYSLYTGEKITGNRIITRQFTIDEYPVFVKAGTILPIAKGARRAKDDLNISLIVFPGADGSFTLYEDDGNDQQYADHYCTTAIRYRHGKVVSSPTVIHPQGEKMPSHFEVEEFQWH